MINLVAIYYENYKKIYDMKRIVLTLLLINFLSPSVKGNSFDTLYVNPNPCDSVTTIHYTISHTDSITLEIFNNLGQATKIFFTKFLMTAGTYSTVYVTDSLPDGFYYVRLKIGASQKSTKFLKSKGNGVGLIEKTLNLSDFNVYPNPTTSILKIEYQGVKNYIIKDITCKTIFFIQTTLNEIDLSNLSPGNYILEIYSDKKKLIATKKIIRSQ